MVRNRTESCPPTCATFRVRGNELTESEIEYLHRRAAEELRLAEAAEDSNAAAIHERMALLYADRIAALNADPELDPTFQAPLAP